MNDDPTSLPDSLRLLWTSPDAGQRGPKRSLTLAEVVGAGIALADAEGLTAVSMARVAESLGFTTMSLYRYVRNKDELLLLMADQANRSVPPPPPPGPGDWRGGLEAWAWGVFRTYRRHPWLLRVAISGPPAGPSQLVWMEAGLRCLAEAATPVILNLQIVQLLHGYARGEAQLNSDLTPARPGAATASYGDILRAVTTPASHPNLAGLLATGVFDGSTDYDETVDFAFGLSTILAGITQLVEQASAGPGPEPG